VLAKQKLVETLQASERELAQRVDDRTRELQALNEKLEALSMVDGLTGIANRRQFDQELRKAWARLERLGQPLALVMLDVDLFKRYNDHYGHQAGDECLRKVAQAMASVGRTTDVLARYGGEEFVMVAPASDGPSALLLAQRACQAVQALGAAHAQSPFGVVTVSCGAASVVPGVGVTPQDLLRQADAALYQAKDRGRNQAVLAGS
jgi:diguanylate cyclase (GGDEF)-like protein